jgi:hypothetical protein
VTADEENGVPFEALRGVQRSERHAVGDGDVLRCSTSFELGEHVGQLGCRLDGDNLLGECDHRRQ